MNRVKRCADVVWSGLSMATFFGLLSMALYWSVLQRPALTYNAEGIKTFYSTSAGATVYFENPIYPPDTNTRVQISPRLSASEGDDNYRLSAVDSTDGFKPGIKDTKLAYVRPGYPVYSVYIPTYVKPGVYTYRATATYRLNLFRTATLELPRLTIVVE